MNTAQKKFIQKALAHKLGVVQGEDVISLIDQQGNLVSKFTNQDDKNPYPNWKKLLDTVDFTSFQDSTIQLNAPIQVDDLVIYTDGGSRGNPGPSASGYVIMDSNESQILEEGGEYLGITTNNQAEYQAVRTALESAVKYQPKSLKFKIDSLLVVNQMNGKYKIKNRELWPIHSAIKELIQTHLQEVEFIHVRREFNKLADQKVNEVLDAQKDTFEQDNGKDST